jgi:hypothetical protein
MPKAVIPNPDDDVDDDVDDDIDDDIDDDVDDDTDDDDDTGSNLTSLFIVLGIVMVVLALIVVAIILFLRSRRKQEEAPRPASAGEVLEPEVVDAPDLSEDVKKMETRRAVAKPYQKPMTAPIAPAPAQAALPPMSAEPGVEQPPKAAGEGGAEEAPPPASEITAELPEEDINIDDAPELEEVPDAQTEGAAKDAHGGEDGFWGGVKPLKR